MMSGRYRTEMLCRFWSDNRSGFCNSSTCNQVHGSLEHLLVVCPGLDQARSRLYQMWLSRSVQFPPLHSLIREVLDSSPTVITQFILEPMAFPLIRLLTQQHGNQFICQVYYLTRTFAYNMHREKQKLLGTWPGSGQTKVDKPSSETTSFLNSNHTNTDYVSGPSGSKEVQLPLVHHLHTTDLRQLVQQPVVLNPVLFNINHSTTSNCSRTPSLMFSQQCSSIPVSADAGCPEVDIDVE